MHKQYKREIVVYRHDGGDLPERPRWTSTADHQMGKPSPPRRSSRAAAATPRSSPSTLHRAPRPGAAADARRARRRSVDSLRAETEAKLRTEAGRAGRLAAARASAERRRVLDGARRRCASWRTSTFRRSTCCSPSTSSPRDALARRAKGGARLAARHLAGSRGLVPGAREVRPRPDGARRVGQARPRSPEKTGSSLPDSASSVRSRPNFSSAWFRPRDPATSTRCEPRTSFSAGEQLCRAERRRGRAGGARWRRTRPRAPASPPPPCRGRGRTRRRRAAAARSPARPALVQASLALGPGANRPTRRRAGSAPPGRGLVEERDAEMLGVDLGVATPARELLRGRRRPLPLLMVSRLKSIWPFPGGRRHRVDRRHDLTLVLLVHIADLPGAARARAARAARAPCSARPRDG